MLICGYRFFLSQIRSLFIAIWLQPFGPSDTVILSIWCLRDMLLKLNKIFWSWKANEALTIRGLFSILRKIIDIYLYLKYPIKYYFENTTTPVSSFTFYDPNLLKVIRVILNLDEFDVMAQQQDGRGMTPLFLAVGRLLIDGYYYCL